MCRCSSTPRLGMADKHGTAQNHPCQKRESHPKVAASNGIAVGSVILSGGIDMATRTTRERIWEAIYDLHSQEQVATREVLAEVTGLTMSQVGDFIKVLVADGRIRRIRAGVFCPVEAMPPARAVSVTLVASGLTKLEVGDAILELTPREARMIGTALAGFAMQFAQIQAGHDLNHIVCDVDVRQRADARAIRGIDQRLAELEGAGHGLRAVQ